jgi:hypothetical protein
MLRFSLNLGIIIFLTKIGNSRFLESPQLLNKEKIMYDTIGPYFFENEDIDTFFALIILPVFGCTVIVGIPAAIVYCLMIIFEFIIRQFSDTFGTVFFHGYFNEVGMIIISSLLPWLVLFVIVVIDILVKERREEIAK